MRKPTGTAALLIAAVSLSNVACDQSTTQASSTPERQALKLAEANTLTLQFAQLTDRLYSGQVQLADLVAFAEPLLSLDRVSPLPDSRGGTSYELEFRDPEALDARLLVLAPGDDRSQDYQLIIQGPVTSGMLQPHATHRGLTIAFGFDAQRAPFYGFGLVRDRVREDTETLRAYEGLASATVGGVYRLGTDATNASESYWRPITLKASYDPGSDETNWFWEFGHKGPVTTGDLSQLEQLAPSLP